MRYVICALLVLGLTGCSGVLLNAEYSDAMDKAALHADQAVTRYDAGQLDPNEVGEVLKLNSLTWQRFLDARDGRESE